VNLFKKKLLMVLRARPPQGVTLDHVATPHSSWQREPASPVIKISPVALKVVSKEGGHDQKVVTGRWGLGHKGHDPMQGSVIVRKWPPLHLQVGHGAMVIVINSTRNVGNAEVKMDDLGRGSHLLVVRWVDGVTGSKGVTPQGGRSWSKGDPPHRCSTLTDPFLQNLLFYHN